jgi:hypothetical protein
MTAALEADEPNAVPSESQLLDVLYEVLAQGVPAKGSLTTEDVERFLHEHARSRKSVGEMLQFFAQHGLPTAASDYGADPALGEFANGLHKERGPISATIHLEGPHQPVHSASESGPIRKSAQLAEVDTAPRARIVTTAEPKRGSWLMAAASLAGVLVLGGALFATYQHAEDLSAQLVLARAQQRTTDAALSALEQRAETLKHSLERSETDRRSLAVRFDEFVVGEAQKRAAEEVALQRLLGSRFETLRDRALIEARGSARE